MLLLSIAASTFAAHPPPNLVFVMVDDLGWNDIGFNDHSIVTPTFNALAAEGILLARHYVYRYCSPTRASLLSGRLPHHAHQTNPGASSPFGTSLNFTLLPSRLQSLGYYTAMRGKWHLGTSSHAFLPRQRGFNDSAGYLSGACDHITEIVECAADSWMANASYDGPDPRNGTGYDSWRHASDMVRIIETAAQSTAPLFLYASLHSVHKPLEAPPAFKALYADKPKTWCETKKTIAGMVSTADNVTGTLVEALKATGLWASTVLVVASDNGGDSGCSSNFPLRGRKRTFFEGGVRSTSLVASGSKRLLPNAVRGTTSNIVIHVSDWFTTFLALGGGGAGMFSSASAAKKSTDPAHVDRHTFPVDGQDVWAALTHNVAAGTRDGGPHANETLVLGYDYAADNQIKSGAILDVATGFKLIVGSQNNAADTLGWDARLYPCVKQEQEAAPQISSSDCTPHCVFNIYTDPSERIDLAKKTTNATAQQWLRTLLARYAAIASEANMPNPTDVEWGEQGRPWDDDACAKSSRAFDGHWGPWRDANGDAKNVSLPVQCSTSEDCNLNGVCDASSGTCTCDPWWTGENCSALNFAPATQRAAYTNTSLGGGANGSSWGASVAKDDSGTYHLFASEWALDCGLAYWTPNSRIVRATSISPTGPFTIVEEVLPTFWTNPQLVRATDTNKTWLLFVDGMDCPHVVDCRNASSFVPPKRLPTCAPHKHMENGISLFSSPALTGPWTPHGLILNGSSRVPNASVPWDYDTTNPAPYVLANGSVLLVYRGCEDGCKGKEMIGVAMAMDWRGPYTRVATPTRPQMPEQAQEDPFVWQDPRGGFHMLTHEMARDETGHMVGMHAWSHDGLNWTLGTPKAAYNKTVLWADGSNTTFAERERPVLLFMGAGAKGVPTHLLNGVRPSSDGGGGGGVGSFPNAPTHTIIIPLIVE